MIAINIGDKIDLFSGGNDLGFDAKVVNINEVVVTIEVGSVRGQIERGYIDSDVFGNLLAPRWRVQAIPLDGQTVFSARGGDTHGCREGWQAEVITSDHKTATAMITANSHCSSCWQTGCDSDRDDNDRKGETIAFNFEDCEIDQHGQIVVNQTIS